MPGERCIGCSKGNTAGRTPYGSVPHLLRPEEVPLGYSFSVILHKTRLITVRSTTLVLYILTKKLAAHLRHYLQAVLPKREVTKMGKPAIMVSSVTNALRGQKLLASHGIRSEILRSSGKGERRGCGYSLAVAREQLEKTRELLVRNGIKVVGTSEG